MFPRTKNSNNIIIKDLVVFCTYETWSYRLAKFNDFLMMFNKKYWTFMNVQFCNVFVEWVSACTVYWSEKILCFTKLIIINFKEFFYDKRLGYTLTLFHDIFIWEQLSPEKISIFSRCAWKKFNMKRGKKNIHKITYGFLKKEKIISNFLIVLISFHQIHSSYTYIHMIHTGFPNYFYKK